MGFKTTSRFARCGLPLLLLLACGTEGGDPMDPMDPDDPAAIQLTSPIGATLAVSRTAQLTAQPVDDAGNPVSGAQITWTSSNDDVASVTAAGLVTAKAAGTVQVNAAAGTVTAALPMRVVAADLGAVSALAADGFGDALGAAVSAGIRAAVQAAWDGCGANAATGNVDAVVVCVDQLRSQSASATDATDRALLAVLVLYADEMRRRLNL